MNNTIEEMIQELDLRGYRVARTEIKKFLKELKKDIRYENYLNKIPIKKLVIIFLNKNKKSRGSIL